MTFSFTDKPSYLAYVAEYKKAIADVEAKLRQAKKTMKEHGNPGQARAQSERQYLRGEATKLYAERVASKVRAGELRAADLRKVAA